MAMVKQGNAFAVSMPIAHTANKCVIPPVMEELFAKSVKTYKVTLLDNVHILNLDAEFED